MPVGRHGERVPGGQNRPRGLFVPQADQQAADSVEEVPAAPVGAADRLRERVVVAVGERVAVDDQQRSHAERSSSSIAAISRSVATCGASSRPARSSSGIGGAVRDPQLREAAEPVGPDDPGRDQRHVRLERDPRRTGMGARLVLLPQPLLAPRALREHDHDVPFAAELRRRLHRLEIGLPTAHRERARSEGDLLQRREEELRLAHEAQVAPGEERHPERPRVEVRVVIRGQDEAAPGRQVLATPGAEPKQPVQQRPAEPCDREVHEARPGRHTRSIPVGR